MESVDLAPAWSAPAAGLPRFEVQLTAPDLTRWSSGNTGLPGFWTFSSPSPGPHVALVALVHGNEIAGAIALDQLLAAGVTPRRGRLTLGFANLEAAARFDPSQPTASRFVDEDLNRVWDSSLLDGSRQSSELARARAMRPLIEQVDILLDLHSMLWPSCPLILSGPTARGRELAVAIGSPSLVVSDAGHASGRRLIDYPRFVDPDRPEVAVLVEAGQHWQRDTVGATLATITALLAHTGLAPAGTAAVVPPRCAEVTRVVTAASGSFAFVQPFRGGDVIARRDTLIAIDGDQEIRTPHDDCLLVMPSLRPSRGHTAVRLAKFV